MAASWKPTESVPHSVYRKNYDTDLNEDERTVVDERLIHFRISKNVTFITNVNRLIYPELKINQAVLLESKPKFNNDRSQQKKIFSDIDLQTWCYDKVRSIHLLDTVMKDILYFQDGYIFNKQLNSLVLTVVSEQQIRVTWKSSRLSERQQDVQYLDGSAVQLRSKKYPSDDQRWKFTHDGYIVLHADSEKALTSVAHIEPNEDGSFVAKGIKVDENDPFVSFVAVCPKYDPNSPFIHRQR